MHALAGREGAAATTSLCRALGFGGTSGCAELPAVPHGVGGLNSSSGARLGLSCLRDGDGGDRAGEEDEGRSGGSCYL